jgi:hypothetical protein
MMHSRISVVFLNIYKNFLDAVMMLGYNSILLIHSRYLTPIQKTGAEDDNSMLISWGEQPHSNNGDGGEL